MKELKIISISLLALGVILYLMGLQFKMMQWPDMFKGTISGPIVFIIGLITFIIFWVKRKK